MLIRRLLLVLLLFPSLALAQAPATTSPASPAAAPPASHRADVSQPAATPPAAATAPADPAAAAEPAVTTSAETPSAAPPPAQGVLPKDLSVWGMFVAADWVVQGVMIGLVWRRC